MRDRRNLPKAPVYHSFQELAQNFSPAPDRREHPRQDRHKLEQEHLRENQAYFFRHFSIGEDSDRLDSGIV